MIEPADKLRNWVVAPSHDHDHVTTPSSTATLRVEAEGHPPRARILQQVNESPSLQLRRGADEVPRHLLHPLNRLLHRRWRAERQQNDFIGSGVTIAFEIVRVDWLYIRRDCQVNVATFAAACLQSLLDPLDFCRCFVGGKIEADPAVAILADPAQRRRRLSAKPDRHCLVVRLGKALNWRKAYEFAAMRAFWLTP